ncbi:MAG: dihydroorotase [Desulfovibrionaceae bacterium]
MAAPELIVRGAMWRGAPVDILVRKGKILGVEPVSGHMPEGCKVVDATGLTLLPSLVDCHVHLRDPGDEYKEDVASGLAAAAHGGFGAVMCMGNTSPVNDSATVTEYMLSQARRHWPKGPRLHPVGALTKGLKGEEMSPLTELAQAGCAAFSNDGRPVLNTELYRRCVEYAADLGLKVIDHCEDPYLAKQGVMNEGRLSGLMGLKGVPTVAESLHVARDILLCGYLGLPIHLAHISCRESVELIAWGKARGFPITAETCPHYLFFTENAVEGYDTAAKVNPPLRTDDDVLAMRQAVSDGTIDMLVTDHAPHAAHEKEVPMDESPNGISGLDTALSLTWGLVKDGVLDMDAFLRAWCYGPGKVFNLPVNAFNEGDPADFVLFDASATWEVTPKAMHSKGKNTPCLGMILPGRVAMHFIGGRQIV